MGKQKFVLNADVKKKSIWEVKELIRYVNAEDPNIFGISDLNRNTRYIDSLAERETPKYNTFGTRTGYVKEGVLNCAFRMDVAKNEAYVHNVIEITHNRNIDDEIYMYISMDK